GITVQERRIGSLEDLTAKDVMTTDIDTIRADTPISDVLDVFQRTSHRGLPLVDERGRVEGIIVRSDLESVLAFPDSEEDRDLVANGGRLVVEAESSDDDVSPETPVQEIGVTDVVTASPHTNLLSLVDRMVKSDVGRVPIVTDDGEIEGIVTRTDVIAAYDRFPVEEIAGARESL
ncbi:MAG: HPP family protein, partial [Halobacteriaceae archaeon]